MAFVFRNQKDPRILPPQSSLSPSSESDHSRQEKSRIKKFPMKGLPCLTLKEDDRSVEVSQRDNLEDEIDKKVQEFVFHRKNTKMKTKDRQQYVFKSKCQRAIFSEDKIKETTEEMKKKEFVMKKYEELEIENQIKKAQEKVEKEKIKNELKEKKAQNILKLIKSQDAIHSFPSIPGKVNKYGYVFRDNQEPHFPTKVEKPRFTGENGDTPGPSDYIIDERSKVKGTIKFGMSLSKSSSKIEAPFIEDQKTLKDYHQHSRIFQERKKGKSKNDIENYRQNKRSHEVFAREGLKTRAESDDDEEYEVNATPGPGYYNYAVKLKKNFRSKNEKYSKIFINQSKRFLEKSCDENYNTFYIKNNPKKKKRNKFFMSRIPRQFLLSTSDNIPPPGYYNTRQTMEHSLIDKMLKNSSMGLFNNNLPRFADEYSNEIPGPGYYEGNLPNFKIEPNRPQFKEENTAELYEKLGIFCDNDKKRKKLKQSESMLIMPDTRKIKDIIHKREDKVVEEENYAPFMSSSPKFNYETQINQKPVRPPRKNILKVKQNMEPFNSSVPKGSVCHSGNKASLGLYDTSNHYQWNTHSHNVLFN